ncbi:uncharacterized protein LOC108628700 [Ceratina calcarata]|uniref:Uncharacterized protein LOC108628700 n=1 Tax=Ceratina calcarata TaxID=156304 RepID=A0AAJ7J6U4_9HYME|nr:uncharacterized protein LOC108628700 [Ceratina calcarata]
MTLSASIIAFSLLVNGALFCNAQYEGSDCTVDKSPGICKRIIECPSVYQELLRGNPPRMTCGYINFDPLVCCPNEVSITMPNDIDTKRPTADSPTENVTPTTKRPLAAAGVGARARAKCEEFSRSVYALVIPPVLSGNHRELVNTSLCASVIGRKLIVGGKKADPMEFPHMAAVGYGNPEDGIKWQCGGTLISERFVISAAHCIYSLNWGTASWVRVGDLNLESSTDPAKPQDIRIVERIKHPNYKRPSEYHDIALLKLEEEAEFNAYVRPSCLPYSLPDSGDDGKATATGWGQVEWAGDQSNDLLKVTISLIAQKQCNKSFSSDNTQLASGIVENWQICAGEVGKDTCQGDSGGPLVVFNRDYYCMYTLIGVTSLGKICGSIAPGVYTRVYNYVSWIEDTVWPDLTSLHPSKREYDILDIRVKCSHSQSRSSKLLHEYKIPREARRAVEARRETTRQAAVYEDRGERITAMIKLSKLVLILFISNGSMFCGAQTEEGDSCIVNGFAGNCTRIRECPPVYNNISRGEYPHVVCGYDKYDPIVCCPVSAPTTSATTIRTTTVATSIRTTTPTAPIGWSKAQRMCTYYQRTSPKFIIGGSKARFAQFVFMAAIGYNSDQGIAWECGGTLISTRFVLTAAHCTYNQNWGNASWVRLGAINLYRPNNDSNPVTRQVEERIRYDRYKRPSEYHDIALLKLAEPVTFGRFIKPCCLPFAYPDVPSTGKAVAVGWGQQEWAGEQSEDLLYVNVDLVPQPICNRSFTNGIKDNKLEWGIVDGWQLCAGGLGKDTCQGDSGGPLVAYLDSQPSSYTVIGITSLGKVCGSITPGVYTRIYNYVPWIEDIVWTDAEVAEASS